MNTESGSGDQYTVMNVGLENRFSYDTIIDRQLLGEVGRPSFDNRRDFLRRSWLVKLMC